MPAVDDAITGEIVRNGLAVAAEEASIVVVRAGHSSHIQEGADACAALVDAGRSPRHAVDRDQPHARRQPAVLAAGAARGLPARHDARPATCSR